MKGDIHTYTWTSRLYERIGLKRLGELMSSPLGCVPDLVVVVVKGDFIRKLLLESILDLEKSTKQKTHKGESASFLVWALLKVQY